MTAPLHNWRVRGWAGIEVGGREAQPLDRAVRRVDLLASCRFGFFAYDLLLFRCISLKCQGVGDDHQLGLLG